MKISELKRLRDKMQQEIDLLNQRISTVDDSSESLVLKQRLYTIQGDQLSVIKQIIDLQKQQFNKL